MTSAPIVNELIALAVPCGRCAVTISRPVDADHRSAIGVVVVPPLGIERNGCDRLLRALAEQLSTDGHTVMIVDPVGTGDSSDLSDDVSIAASFEQGVRAGVASLREHCDRVLAIGIRFGALTLATAFADDPLLGTRIDGALLWSPISRGASYRRELIMLGSSTDEGLADGWAAPAGSVLRPLDLTSIGELDLRRVPAPSRHLFVLEDEHHRLPAEVLAAWAPMAAIRIDASAGIDTAVLEDPERGTVCSSTVQTIAAWVNDQPTRAARAVKTETVGAELIRDTRWLEEPVAVVMSDGHVLHGVRTSPCGSPSSAGLVLLSTGTNPRFGPARLHTSLARSLASEGFSVLRIERRGGGTSAGELDAYDPLHIADVLDIDKAAANILGTSTVVVAGMCSGAWAAWHATLAGMGAERVILINQVIFGDDSWDLSEGSPAIAVKTRQSLGSIARWKALLQGEINVARSARRLLQYASMTARSHLGHSGAMTEEFATLVRRETSVTFIFDSEETGLRYLELHAANDIERLKVSKQIRVVTVERAGHVFAPPAQSRWLHAAMLGEMQDVAGSKGLALGRGVGGVPQTNPIGQSC